MLRRLVARQGLTVLVGIVVAGGVTSCGDGGTATGNTGGSGNFQIAPEDVLLAIGQSANVAVVTPDAVSRQDEAGVVVSGWSVGDDSIAGVVASGDAAVVTGLAAGQTTLTASSNQGSLTATIRVGDQTVSGPALDALASFLTAAAAAGDVDPNAAEPPPVLAAPATLLDALATDLGPPARMAAFVLNPAAFQRTPVSFTAADLTLAGAPAANRAATHDGVLELQIRIFLRTLERAGCPMGPFFAAVAQARFHEEGQQADGVRPRPGVPAVTFEPGPTIYNGGLVVITDGHTHTVFSQSTAQAIRMGQLIADNKLTEAGSTVLHELAHIALFVNGQGALDSEALIGMFEALIRAKADLMLTSAAGAADPGSLQEFFSSYGQIVRQPNGAAVLQEFGLFMQPAAPTLTAPQEVNTGQTFTVNLTLAGTSARPNEDVLVIVRGAAQSTGQRIVRTGPGGSATISITAGPDEGDIEVEATFLTSSQTVFVAVVNASNPSAYLILDHRLESEFAGYPAGSVIFLSRVTGGTVQVGHGNNCGETHLHGPIRIDGDGPFDDPDPTGCGHGHVFHHGP